MIYDRIQELTWFELVAVAAIHAIFIDALLHIGI
jgi:hypothetical protein